MIKKNEVEDEIEFNFKVKENLEFALKDLENFRVFKCLEDENQVIFNEIQVLKEEVEYLSKENSAWFKEYQESVECLEEVFGRRKVYIEGIYRDMFDKLEELKMREILLDQQILQLERKKSQVAVTGLAIMYKKRFASLEKTGFSEVLLIILLILIGVCLILF
jgi:hypothetical protein